MKKLKRLITFLFALMLPLCASAEPLRAQINAPEAYQATYYSNTGRSKVSVDAEVVVPDVAAINRYEVVPRFFMTGETEMAADLYFGDDQWWHGDTEKAEVEFFQVRGDRGIVCGCNLYALGGIDPYLGVTSETVEMFGRSFFYQNYLEITNEQGGWSRKVGTAAEARQTADSIVNSVWPEMVYAGIDPKMQPGTYRIGNCIGGDDRRQYGYRVYYCRVVDDIPITPVTVEISPMAMEEAYVPPLQYESLFVDVDADGIFCLRYESPIEVTNLLEENVTLLTFPEIMEIFGKIAPMTIAEREMADTNELFIDRIVLGYMCVPIKSDITRYHMIPVWDFFGVRTVQDEIYDQYMKPWVTINAIDGTVIDRMYGY